MSGILTLSQAVVILPCQRIERGMMHVRARDNNRERGINSMIDCHLHSVYSQHGSGSLREMAVRASDIGIEEIGFSEHLPHPPNFDNAFAGAAMKARDLEPYLEEAVNLRDYPPPGVKVRVGLEIDYLPGFEEWTGMMLEDLDLDFVIGSVHYIGGRCFDYCPDEFTKALNAYPERLPAATRWPSFPSS